MEEIEEDEHMCLNVQLINLAYFDDDVFVHSVSHHTLHDQVAYGGRHAENGGVHIIGHGQKYINHE